MLMHLIHLYLVISVVGTILIIGFLRGASEERKARPGKEVAADQRKSFVRMAVARKQAGEIAT
jgi:hypothetical protein